MSNTIPIVMSLLFNLNFNLTLIKKEKYNKEKVKLDVFSGYVSTKRYWIHERTGGASTEK